MFGCFLIFFFSLCILKVFLDDLWILEKKLMLGPEQAAFQHQSLREVGWFLWEEEEEKKRGRIELVKRNISSRKELPTLSTFPTENMRKKKNF